MVYHSRFLISKWLSDYHFCVALSPARQQQKAGEAVVWFQVMCPVLCWPLAGQKSNRTRYSVLAVPWGACQVYLAHRMGGDEYAQEIFNVEKNELPNS